MANKLYRYRNIAASRQMLIGFGAVAPQAVVESARPIRNANFALVEDEQQPAHEDKAKSKPKANKEA